VNPVKPLAHDSTYNAAMNEHRIAPRRRMLKAGTIEFGGGGIDCTVRNISETGAALEVVTPLFIPDRFTLFVPTEQLKRPCHIVWRREKRIGVTFD
jgi:PilZ domain